MTLRRQVEFLTLNRAVTLVFGTMCWAWSALIFNGGGVCEASILHKSDFENNERTSWSTFVTPNGTVGEAGWPIVASFEMTQEGQWSKALKFKVGQVRSDPDREQGGGLVLQITTQSGKVELSAHVAVTYHSPKDARNLAGGLFEWILDDHIVASHNMGPIDHGGVLRHHLRAQHSVNTGVHTFRLRITRPFVSHRGQHAPLQYVDDLLIRFLPKP